jgi:hypothetical protein
VWGIKLTALKEYADFATLGIDKLFSKLKSHELSCKGRPNHDTSLTSKIFIASSHIGCHDANPTNITVSYVLEFALSSLVTAFNEQYESIPDDKIIRRGGDHLGATSSVATPPTSSPTSPRGRSSIPPISLTTPSGMTTTRVTTRRSTASGPRKRRNSKRSYPERVLHSVTSTSPIMTPPAQRRMRRSSAGKATSLAFASWASL